MNFTSEELKPYTDGRFWYIVSADFVPVTKGSMGRGTFYAHAYLTKEEVVTELVAMKLQGPPK